MSTDRMPNSCSNRQQQDGQGHHGDQPPPTAEDREELAALREAGLSVRMLVADEAHRLRSTNSASGKASITRSILKPTTTVTRAAPPKAV